MYKVVFLGLHSAPELLPIPVPISLWLWTTCWRHHGQKPTHRRVNVMRDLFIELTGSPKVCLLERVPGGLCGRQPRCSVCRRGLLLILLPRIAPCSVPQSPDLLIPMPGGPLWWPQTYSCCSQGDPKQESFSYAALEFPTRRYCEMKHVCFSQLLSLGDNLYTARDSAQSSLCTRPWNATK